MTMMRENNVSPLGRIAISLFLLLCSVASVVNVVRGEVRHPYAFVVVLVGLVCFLTAKTSVIVRSKWISFGPRPMSQGMGDLYRIGYWLMVVGALATFAP